MISVAAIVEEFRLAGVLLFVDTDNELKGFPHSNPKWSKLEQIVRGRQAEIARYLTFCAMRGAQ